MWQLRIGIAVGLAVICGAYYWWSNGKINDLTDKLNIAITNTALLEQSVETQNQQIETLLVDQEQSNKRINDLQNLNREAETKVSELRKTFDEHNLNNLSLAKPGLIENIINRGTKKVYDNIRELTNPDRQVENDEENSDTP